MECWAFNLTRMGDSLCSCNHLRSINQFVRIRTTPVLPVLWRSDARPLGQLTKGNKMKFGIITLAVFSLTTLLTACGGGSGGSTPVANAVVEGAWTGTTSTGYAVNLVTLEDGSTYSLFGTNSTGVFYVSGFDQGTLSISGNTISGTLKEYEYTGATVTGTVNATATTGVSINGSITAGTVSSTFSLTPLSSTYYSYSAPANTSNVVGTWAGTMLNGTSATVVIGTNGSISGSNNGCTFVGSAAPRVSGKNIFNVNLTFGAAPCLLPNQTATGIALNYTVASGLKQLIVAVQDSTKAAGTVFIAQR